ncbi:Rha family transcriptional regulator [Pseudomonas typographi]|uniref:DNA-binding protein n=1 Tax=Pseudomonas typographi TaxID=2715964 RepID=A0ABR7Z6K0_9PSED|nr:Rha family transcriptional regulator [Pseudomonas typographi]MBD1601159.1 hypothetical protein [Pseudomonas typographi]
MNLIANTATMTSLEIADLVGKRHDNVKRTIETLIQRRVITSPQIEEKPTGGRPTAEYVFTGDTGKRDSLVVVAQLSPEFTGALVDRWQTLESRVGRPQSMAEQLLASAQVLVGIEQEQLRQQLALERVESRMEVVEELRFLSARPSGFESITHVRERINKRHGLPGWLIDLVMRDLPRSPLPFAMVKSDHAEERAQPYAIWPTAGVTRLFDEFVRECTRVTAERATHPEIAQRFKIRPEAV